VKHKKAAQSASSKNCKKTKRAKTTSSKAVGYAALFIAVTLAVDLAIAYWGHTAWVLKNRTAQLSVLSQDHARITAADIADNLQRYQKQLDAVAQETQVAAILANRAPEALTSLEKRLESMIDASLAIRALPVNSATAPTGPRTLRFAELDMVARAEKREDVLPEAARQNDQWVVNLVATVPQDASAPVYGTLLLTLPLDVLQPALSRGNQGLGRAELQQSFNGHQTTQLLTAGSGDAGEAAVSDVADSYWQVKFIPSAQLWQQTQVSLALPISLWLGLTLVSLVLAGYVGYRIGRGKQATAKDSQRGSPSAPSGGKEDDILDVVIADEDEALLGLDKTGAKAASNPPIGQRSRRADIPDVIFRAYDIRGLANTEISPQLAQQIGQALGSEALEHKQHALIVARDARIHSPLLAEHLVRGILSTGCNVVNIGTVPTPLMYFATETLPQTQSGVMVTASHNAAEYNGFKVVMTGKSRSANDIQNLRKRIVTRNFRNGDGTEERLDIAPRYLETITSDVALAGDIHVVVDAGNGVTGTIAPQLFERLGCRVTPLYCDLDGNFPNHEPDPSVASNLRDLTARVQEEQADVGIAFDGDGDRLTIVTPKGEIIWADRLLMLFAKDIVARNPGADVVFDVKSTRQLGSAITSFGGRPVMWKTGHAPMRAKMLESGALLGGEFSGHIFIKERWYGFDDGIYAAARLLEIMSSRHEDLDSIFAEFPPAIITPEILIAVAEDRKFAIVRQLVETGDFGDAKLNTLDGLRADFPSGWGLIRASNTSPNLTLRFEADTEGELQQIIDLFARELKKVDPDLVLKRS
jgi:phosphomannomutase/phosphoglucomutase